MLLPLFDVCDEYNEMRFVGFISAAAKIAACEATLHEAACKQCCDSSFSGLFGFAEKPACHAACKVLPAPPVKRQFGLLGGKICLNCRPCCIVH